ncbi:MAG: tRNA (N(6)-L-threonylcarbamoyladenosine(37)-C(2))-methylthiotransferase MtaB [Spirochaetes bacterium]|nr:tRNA (N(6)-L-threonylcarbamoyladenosine(37)-C(2))-methylthiotransferase MtaB [Spirochaetota bacterium]
MKIKISSLGCRLNQSEIESVSTVLQDMGHAICRDDDADLFIINTCTVTARSDSKTRQLIRHAEAAAARRGGAKIIVAGCAAETACREGDIYYLPNDWKPLIPELIADWDLFDRITPPPCARFAFATPLKSSTSRVNLKIQDGCDSFCSYCIVPLVRGAPQSKPAEQVAREFRELVDAGYREVVLTGVMIGRYDDAGTGLADLAERLLSMDGRFRIHMTSITPVFVTPKLVDLLRHEKMVKHLHLSLQSGSNAILRKMNRPYTREEYRALAGRIRTAVPDFNLTTDVIVGFPGETDRDFEDTLTLIRDAGFSHVHTFRFSPRPGTKAAEMEDTVPEKIKTERSRTVIGQCSRQKREYYSRFNGRESEFLSERSRGGITTGFNQYYSPIEVKEKLPRNRFYAVVTSLEPGRDVLTGSLL